MKLLANLAMIAEREDIGQYADSGAPYSTIGILELAVVTAKILKHQKDHLMAYLMYATAVISGSTD